VASAEDRLEMCRLATQSLGGIEVSDLEVRRGGRSYTLETLIEIQEVLDEAELHLILGWDAARELRSWREPGRVLARSQLVVVSRPGLAPPSQNDLAAAGLDPDQVLLCPVRTPDVTATKIRALAAEGQPLTGLVDPRVEAYLTQRRLYAMPSPRVHNQGVE
jgi:nicotinate-nucleotide adenylyltransferase